MTFDRNSVFFTALLHGAMLTGSMRRNFQNLRYFWHPV